MWPLIKAPWKLQLHIWIRLLGNHSNSPHRVQHLVLWSLSHVSLSKHQFVPLLNLFFSIYLVVFSGSYKGSIVPPMPFGEREPSLLFFCLLFLIFFQLSGQDLRGSADTYQGWEMAKIIIKQARCVQLFAWFTKTCYANGKFQQRDSLQDCILASKIGMFLPRQKNYKYWTLELDDKVPHFWNHVFSDFGITSPQGLCLSRISESPLGSKSRAKNTSISEYSLRISFTYFFI